MVNFRNNLLLANFLLLLLLNYGYMQLRLPQAQIGVPISEWLLLFAIATTQITVVIGRMRNMSILLPYFLWLAYGSALIILSYPDYGIKSVRAGLPVIESLFLYIGFVFAGDHNSMEKLKKWLPILFVVASVYCALRPFSEDLKNLSPAVSGMQGQTIPIFFYMVSTPVLQVVAAAYALERYRVTDLKKYLIYAGGALSLAVVLMPSRTLLLLILVLIIYFWFSSSGRLKSGLAWAIAIGMTFLLILLSLDIQNTRLGITTLSGYKTLFLEIFPGTESTLTSGSADRFRWWLSAYDRLTASWTNLIFGLGYGAPLTDLELAGGISVNSIHNTIIGVAAHGGLMAILIFVWFQSVIVYRAWGAVSYLRKNSKDCAIFVALLFLIFSTHVYGIGESPFDWPFFLVPYYFSAGILLRINKTIMLDRHATG